MLNTNRVITGVSLSHNTTAVTEIEPLTVTKQNEVVSDLVARDGVHEAFVLHTCSRVEAYIVTETTTTAETALNAYLTPLPESVTRTAEWLLHDDAIRHLMRVAGGLESIVPGEDHILGQLKTARKDAEESNALTDGVLGPAVSKAIRVGERARTETNINDGIVSLSSAAAQKAREDHDLDKCTVMVVGAGEIATTAADHIAADTNRLIVANRTRANAQGILHVLADETSVEFVGLDELPERLPSADVVISATGSNTPVLTADNLREAGKTTVIDIAQPADLAQQAAALTNIRTIRLDDLTEITEKTRNERDDAIQDVEEIIETAFDELLSQYKRERADAVASGMHRGADAMKNRELQQAFDRLEATDTNVTDDQREIINDLADALVSQLLAAPTESLYDAAENDDWNTLHTAIKLFDPTTTTDRDSPPTPPKETPNSVSNDKHRTSHDE